MKKSVFLGRVVLMGMCAVSLVEGNVWAKMPLPSVSSSAVGEGAVTNMPHQNPEDPQEAARARKAALKKEKEEAEEKKATKKAQKHVVQANKDALDNFSQAVRAKIPTVDAKFQSKYVIAISAIAIGKKEAAVLAAFHGETPEMRAAIKYRLSQAESCTSPSVNFFSRTPKFLSSRDIARTLSMALVDDRKDFLRPTKMLLSLDTVGGTKITSLQKRAYDKTCQELTQLSKKPANIDKIVSFTEMLGEDAKYRVRARIIVGKEDKKEEARIQKFLRELDKSLVQGKIQKQAVQGG